MPLDREILKFASQINALSPPGQRKGLDKSILAFAESLQAGQPASYQPVREYEDEFRAAEDEKRLAWARGQLEGSPLPGFKAYGVAAGAPIVSSVARLLGKGEYADEMTRGAMAIEQAQREREKGGVIPDILQRGVRGAAASLTTMVPATAVAGPYGAITAASAQEANRAITEGKDAGLEGARLAAYAIGQGVVEGTPAAVMQRVGLGGVESAISRRSVSTGVREGLKRLGVIAAQELPEELVTEITHNVVAKISGVDPGALSVGSLKRTVADTTVQTLITVGFVGAPGVARSAAVGKRAGIEASVLQHAAEGKVPSRMQWRQWGLSNEEGRSRKRRRKVTKEMAGQIRAVKEARLLIEKEASMEQPAEPAPATPAGPVGVPQATEVPEVTPEVEAVPEAPGATEEAPGEVQAARPAVQEARRKAEPKTDPATHDFAVEKEGTGERVGGREVVRDMERIWGKEFQVGRLWVKRARGTYEPHSQKPAIAKGEEGSAAVASHELAHHLDGTSDILHGISEAAKKELAALDYDQEQMRPGEGFAEFMRATMTGSTAHVTGVSLKDKAPEFSKHFDQWLKKNPNVEEKVLKSKSLIDRFRRAGAVGRVKGQVSKTGKDESAVRLPPRKRLKKLWDSFWTRIKNEGLPVQRFTEEAALRGYKPGKGVSPYEVYGSLRRIGPHFAANAFERGVFKVTNMEEKIGPSMAEALAEIREDSKDSDDSDYTNFIAWMYARHAVESWGKGKNPGITLEDAEETVKRLHDARYERAADKVTQFNNALIDVLSDVGAIDEETGEKVKAFYKTYIPLERAKAGRVTGAGQKLVDLSSAIRGRKGSGLQIVDPLEATLARAVRMYERAARHLVTEGLAKVTEATEGMGDWMKEVPAKTVAEHFKVGDIKNELADLLKEGPGGFNEEATEAIDALLDSIDPMEGLTIFRPDLMKVKGEPIVRVIRKGKPRFYLMHPTLHEALGGLDVIHDLNIANQVAKAFTGVMKFGATRANPSFLPTNALKDLQVFLMQGEKGLKGAFDPVQAATVYVMSELERAAGRKGNPVVELFQHMGGELSTYVGLDRNRLKKGVKRALTGKQSGLTTASNILGVTEVASRIAEFRAILKKEGWLEKVNRGESPPMPVLIRAINAAHDVTTDFRRMGSWGRYLNYYIPFINAQMEGLNKTVRTFKKYPARTALRVALNRVPLALMYWWYKHDDDDYKERPEWQDGYYVFTSKDGEAIWRIPKPHEWGLIDSAVERLMDALYSKDPEAIERWGKQAFKTAMPNTNPAGITPALESIFNYDLFRDRPIVSDALAKLEGPEQYYEHTSIIAKDAANILHKISGGRIKLSPAKIDHLANGLTGGMYRRVGEPVRKAAEGSRWSASDVPGLKGLTLRKQYHKSVDDFYIEQEAASKLHESNKVKVEKGKKPVKEDVHYWRRLENVESLMAGMRKAARSLSEEEKEVTSMAIAGLARQALDRKPLDSYPSPFLTTEGLPSAVRKVVDTHIGQKASVVSRNVRGITPKSVRIIESARVYLRDMGATDNVAQRTLYKRLRLQGLSVSAAKKRSSRLIDRLP